MRAATETSNGKRAQEYHANRRRAERGTVLGPLDAAVLKYTGQYLHGATVPRRMPDAVEPVLLPEVMRVSPPRSRRAPGCGSAAIRDGESAPRTSATGI
ncbi:hypothetical protein SMICM304S_04232 [Streptomyces microflavus]